MTRPPDARSSKAMVAIPTILCGAMCNRTTLECIVFHLLVQVKEMDKVPRNSSSSPSFKSFSTASKASTGLSALLSVWNWFLVANVRYVRSLILRNACIHLPPRWNKKKKRFEVVQSGDNENLPQVSISFPPAENFARFCRVLSACYQALCSKRYLTKRLLNTLPLRYLI